MTYNNNNMCQVTSNCLSPQSWWVWTDSEIRDLWYNCIHDNATNTWLCASTHESGKVFVCVLAFACLFSAFLHLWIIHNCQNVFKLSLRITECLPLVL